PQVMEQSTPVHAAVARHLAGGDVLVRIDQRTGRGSWAPGDHLYLARVGADGELRWQRRWTGSNERGFEIMSNDRDDIVVASRRGSRAMVLRWLDADGRLQDQRETACADRPCNFEGVRLDGQGRVLLLRRLA